MWSGEGESDVPISVPYPTVASGWIIGYLKEGVADVVWGGLQGLSVEVGCPRLPSTVTLCLPAFFPSPHGRDGVRRMGLKCANESPLFEPGQELAARLQWNRAHAASPRSRTL